MDSVTVFAVISLSFTAVLFILTMVQVKYQKIIEDNYLNIQSQLAGKNIIITRAILGDHYRFKLDIGDTTTTRAFLPWKTYKILRKMEKDGAWCVTCSLLHKKKPVKVRKQAKFYFNPK